MNKNIKKICFYYDKHVNLAKINHDKKLLNDLKKSFIDDVFILYDAEYLPDDIKKAVYDISINSFDSSELKIISFLRLIYRMQSYIKIAKTSYNYKK